ncbi:exopolyphosphatase [Paraglaciecola sp. 20A4]|uniref:exopolyphosphatase n=1 Tax=Paraglaciecola sp. 20A4 TaxID=2687288 RepID=UPI00140C0E18|nr:exopolyphosphatase [Paraglaciecola sp. 20A4]
MPNDNAPFDGVEVRDTSKIAALDIGSNSFHLVVARVVAGSVQILHRVKQKVRLAQGLSSDYYLDDEAQKRGLDALNVVAESLQDFPAENVRIVATYTLRKAHNAKAFIRAARDILPYPIEVIGGAEEARLIYLGVAHTNHDDGQRLVVDIGGGSTEFIIGQGFEPKMLRSLQMGCVSYTQIFFKNNELKSKSFERAITAAQQELEMIDKGYLRAGWKTCIGTSGTIRNIIQIAQNESVKDSEGKVTLAQLTRLMKVCCDAGSVDKLQISQMSEDRKPVFAAGLAILIAIFKSLNIDSMLFSPAALREGVLYEMEAQLTRPDVRQRSAESVATRYDVDVEQAQRVHSVTMAIYQSCKDDWNITNKELKGLLGWSALLHEVGLQINTHGTQRHSAYILHNIDLPGFNQEQQTLIATLVRFYRKKIRPADIPDFTLLPSEQIYKLIAILRLGVLLNIKRQDDILPNIEIKVKNNSIRLTFPDGWLENKPIFSADLTNEAQYLLALDLQLRFE